MSMDKILAVTALLDELEAEGYKIDFSRDPETGEIILDVQGQPGDDDQ